MGRGPNKPGSVQLPFSPEREELYLKVLRETGEKQIALEEVGVCRNTVWLHRKKDEEFAEAELDALRSFRANRIEKEIQRRAIDGIDEPIYWNGVIVGHKKVFSDRLLLELAKRHIPAYREKVKIEQDTRIRADVNIKLEADLEILSTESLVDLQRILEREDHGQQKAITG